MNKAALLIAALALSGCASTLMPNSRAEAAIAAALHEPNASDVHIIARSEQWPVTYLTVQTTHHGRHECTVAGGTVDSLGIIYPPSCT